MEISSATSGSVNLKNTTCTSGTKRTIYSVNEEDHGIDNAISSDDYRRVFDNSVLYETNCSSLAKGRDDTVENKKRKTAFKENPFGMRIFIKYGNSKQLYEFMSANFTHLHLSKLSYDWFIFIFENRPQNEVYRMMERINESLTKETRLICPDPKDIWNWSLNISPGDVSIVILGQDPYHSTTLNERNETVRMADGTAFSVSKEYGRIVKGLPASLINIAKLASPLAYKCGTFNGNLGSWVSQGVLLLNTVLTTVAKQPNAHQNIGWNNVTDQIITSLNGNSNHHLIFMLWGVKACNKSSLIDIKKHIILKSKHPSPLSNLSRHKKAALPSTSQSSLPPLNYVMPRQVCEAIKASPSNQGCTGSTNNTVCGGNIANLMVPTSEKNDWFASNHFEMANLYLANVHRKQINWNSFGKMN